MSRARQSIFEKSNLNPSQLRTVADRRLDDALFLCRSEIGARANAAMYLGGFAIECLLKARLLEKHRWLQSAGGPAERTESDAHLWRLCYRYHDLLELLEQLPEVARPAGDIDPADVRSLREVCGTWTIFARYSPRQATIKQAWEFVDTIKEVWPWLKN